MGFNYHRNSSLVGIYKSPPNAVWGLKSPTLGVPSPFSFTLGWANDTPSNVGDDSATVDSNLTTALASDTGWIDSYGTSLYSTYTGYYSISLAFDSVVTIRCMGASSSRPGMSVSTNQCVGFGRNIEATFNLSAGTILVFFYGKCGTYVSGNGGAGGGASMVATYDGATLDALVVAAGGSACSNYQVMHDSQKTAGTRTISSALELTSSGDSYHSTLRTLRDARTTYSYTTSYYTGIGRSTAGNAGAGIIGNGLQYDGTDSGSPDPAKGLYEGATGSTNTSNGGFGGGGGGATSNSFAGAGGGYLGGVEVGYVSTYTTTEYLGYSPSGSSAAGYYQAPISYVNASAISWSDNGLHHTAYDSSEALTASGSNDIQISGRVEFDFIPQA